MSKDTNSQRNAESSTEVSVKSAPSSRRRFLTQAGIAGLGVLAATQAPASAQQFTGDFGNDFARLSHQYDDYDVLNFALNLEYLEAEFYLRAAFGTGLNDGDITGRGNNSRGGNVDPGAVSGGRQVNFQNDLIRQYAEEIARDEEAHVRLLRGTLGSRRVARPTLDIGQAFASAAQAAGLGRGFDPYADDISFLLGAFIFEDVGVTAYRGGAPLLNNKKILSVAAGLLGVEAYHAAEVRTTLFAIATQTQNQGILDATEAISNLRDAASGNGDDDQGIGSFGRSNIVPTDGNALVYERSVQQVLNIVYLSTAPLGSTHSGGFFPNGLFGKFR